MQLVEIRPGLGRLGKNLIGGHPEYALGFLEFVRRKRAERAGREANVGRVDVAIEDVEDFLAALTLFLFARDAPKGVQIPGAIELKSIFPGKRYVRVDLALDLPQHAVRNWHGRSILPPGKHAPQ